MSRGAKPNETLKAKVLEVCRNYCLQVWNEALNHARVKASSTLRRAKSVYYPPTIRAPASTSSKADTPSDVAKLEKDSPDKVALSSSSLSKKAE